MKNLFTGLLIIVLGLSVFPKIAFAAKPERNDNLGGLNLNSYCSHLGLTNDSHVKSNSQSWYCTATDNDAKLHIKVGEACEFQYGKSATVSKEVVAHDPYTYNCFN